MDNLELGGNVILRTLGKKLVNIGTSFLSKGNKTIVSNYTAKFINPFLLLINFTANDKKYQIIIEGDYKEKYKEFGTETPPISDVEIRSIIKQKRKKWYLKK